MTTGRTFWFILAGLCVTAAVLIFGGRTMLSENLGGPLYRTLIVSAYVLLGGAAGSLTRAFSPGNDAEISPAMKVHDGATFTLAERSRPGDGQGSYYWLGDNGQELGVTDEEAAEHGSGARQP